MTCPPEDEIKRSHPQVALWRSIHGMARGGRTGIVIRVESECGRYGGGAGGGVSQRTVTGSTDSREGAGGWVWCCSACGGDGD